MRDKDNTMHILRGAMRFQSIAFALYGASFFLVPDFVVGTVFGWETSSVWARSVGAVFVGVAWLEWNVATNLETRRDLVWPFAAIPGLLLAAMVWEKAAGTYEGSDAYFWMVVAVTASFTALIGGTATNTFRTTVEAANPVNT